MTEVVVCGGARSLVSDIKRVPLDTIKISCNHHAANMLACDYIISIEHDYIIEPLIRFMDIPLLDTKGLTVAGYTGTVGVDYALRRMKAKKVYIAGMDLYTTDYYWSEDAPKGVSKPFRERLSLWEYYRTKLGELSRRVVPLSGPLVDIWQS